ncbi:CamS family sex pheromone protein, partial [Staphylococcus capitis]|uniref:CamS family sex pheromone protein n=1 Tax=Staphylococcus capitis TaxID=29388 RepID=UPI00164315F0
QNKNNKPNQKLPLNPSHNPQTHQQKIPKQSPPYLSNILQQDFYANNHSKPKNIKPMTIPLPINTLYYYQKQKHAQTYT